MSNRRDKQLKRKAKKLKTIKNKSTAKPDRSLELAHNEKLQVALRAQLLSHIKETEVPLSIVNTLSHNEALLMIIEQVTMYTKVNFDELVAYVSDEGKDKTWSFLRNNTDKKIVAFQEDNSPLLTYAFDKLAFSSNKESALPKEGLYLSTRKQDGMRIVVESAYGEEPDEFYFVDIIDEANKDDYLAIGDELDKKQWESLVAEYGLIHESEYVARG